MRRSDGVPFRKSAYKDEKLSGLLDDIFMSEDWGDGNIVIHNTRKDEDIEVVIHPSKFYNANKVRDLINSFCKDLAVLVRDSDRFNDEVLRVKLNKNK